MTFAEGLGAIPGVVSLICAAVGYGHLKQKVTDMEKVVNGENGLTEKLNSLNEKAATLEERSFSHTAKLNDIKNQVDKLVDRLIQSPSRTRR